MSSSTSETTVQDTSSNSARKTATFSVPFPQSDFNQAAADAIGEGMRTEWPRPQPLHFGLPAAPHFDCDKLLPEPLAEFVQDSAERINCSPEYIAAAVMCFLGSAIGARVLFCPKQNDTSWVIAPNLWGFVVGDPSCKKSPAIGAAIDFLKALEKDAAEQFAEQALRHRAAETVHASRVRAIECALEKATQAGSEEDIRKHTEELVALGDPEAPTPRRFQTNDATIASLADLLVKNPDGLLVLRDELTGLFRSLEKAGNEADRAFLLEAFNGTGSFNLDRISRGNLVIQNHCVSIFGGIQPEALTKFIEQCLRTTGNDGFLQRFQLAVYPEPPAYAFRDRPPSAGLRDKMLALFRFLCSFAPMEHGARAPVDGIKYPFFQFDEAAYGRYKVWDRELHCPGDGGEPTALMRQHLSKYPKLLGALCLTLHLAEMRSGPVRLDTLERAAAWCDLLKVHARRIYALGEQTQVTAAQTLGKRLQRGAFSAPFSARDVVRRGWTGLTSMEVVEQALFALKEAHWLVPVAHTSSVGRPPSTRYVVNPALADFDPDALDS